MMTALPKNIRMKPMPEMMDKRRQLRTMRKKALAQEEQKCLSVRTT